MMLDSRLLFVGLGFSVHVLTVLLWPSGDLGRVASGGVRAIVWSLGGCGRFLESSTTAGFTVRTDEVELSNLRIRLVSRTK